MKVQVLAITAITLVITFSCSPLVRRCLVRFHFLDNPNDRSAHHTPVPRGGGVAVLIGCSVGALLASTIGMQVSWHSVGPIFAIGLVGLADDRLSLSPVIRLLSQIIIGGWFGSTLGGTQGIILGMVAMVIFVNVVNFMDGTDGITSLTMITLGVAILSFGSSSPVELTALGALIIGGAAGFLPWNYLGGKMFLGDVGSYLFGGFATIIVLLGLDTTQPLLLPAALSIYLADVFFTLARRIIQRKPAMQAHREHVYQRLSHTVGLTNLQVLTLVSGFSILAILAVTTFGSSPLTLLMVLSLLGLYLASPMLIARSTNSTAVH